VPTAPHVLIVADHPEICDLLRKELTAHGCICISAGSAAEMRRALAADVFDLVLLDVVLSDEPGLPIVEDASMQPVPVILMSDHAAAARQYGDGERSFLGKPFKIDDLVDTVVRMLGKATAPPPRA
jgi:two-component system OmpR family response regulator